MIDFGDSDGSNDGILCTGAPVDSTMEGKLNEMVERLWEIDRISSDV